ncbi:hypothetical protein GGS24DRAFT_501121 [Hypoxylon argillaceum]|nr:hypothetical protein GGS24DRAFT_501121 [Hypoxylon argillaceum]
MQHFKLLSACPVIHDAGPKNADYVLVLDIAEDAPVQKTISRLIQQISFLGGTAAHVNQTDYPPIYKSPIAVSIETKTASSSRDCLLQLGAWVAAWHRRAYILNLMPFKCNIPDWYLSYCLQLQITTGIFISLATKASRLGYMDRCL